MWRITTSEDDAAIIEMCIELNREDPGPRPVPKDHTQRTLAELREQPLRGQAVVLELGGRAAGYAFLISFWSNELGGEICVLDEIYVRPEARGRGHGQSLIQSLIKGSPLWPRACVAIDLEVTPTNARARALYSSLGFQPAKNSHLRFRL